MKAVLVKIYLVLAQTFLLVACTRQIEVPIEHVGVVKEKKEIKSDVLPPGRHDLDSRAVVILLPTKKIPISQEFDVLFSDSSSGDIQIQGDFVPIVDSLPAFYRQYQQHHVDLVVNALTRVAVRQSLLTLNPSDKSIDQFKVRVVNAITHHRELRRYGRMKRVRIVALTLHFNGTNKIKGQNK